MACTLDFRFVRQTFYLFLNRQVEGFDWLNTVAAVDSNPHSFADLTHVAYVSFYAYIFTVVCSFRIRNLLCRIQRKTITIAVDIRNMLHVVKSQINSDLFTDDYYIHELVYICSYLALTNQTTYEIARRKRIYYLRYEMAED